MNIWIVVAWTIAAAWFGIIVVFVLACRKMSVLLPMKDRPESGEYQKLSVLVAARNESNCIENCVRSLLGQDYPGLEVVAINDRSTDDTPEILDRLALEFEGRLRVIHVANLPVGWFGKPHALNLGLQVATGSLVCFTDADCVFQAPSALRTTVTELNRRRLDLFSIAAIYTMNTLRESVVVPCCSEVLLTWLRPERIEDPRWPDAFANGAFILARRAQFDKIGGWGAVRTKISEDLQLARLAKRSGLRVGLAHGEGFYQTESYRTASESWNGWSRIFKGTLTPVQLSITVGRMFVLFLLPLGAVLWGLFDALSTGNPEWLTRGAGLGFAVAFGCRCLLDVAMFRLVSAPIMAAPLAPLGRLFVMAAAVRALFSHAGLVHTYWRGATFSAGQMVMLRRAKPESQIP